jgi:hypothetical protein
MTRDEVGAVVERLYAEHLEERFPSDPNLRSESVAGVELVLVDADVAGCVDTWIRKRGSLDAWRKDVLAASVSDLDRVIPIVPEGPSRRYFERLRELAVMVLSAT